jgi:hypothetical protein
VSVILLYFRIEERKAIVFLYAAAQLYSKKREVDQKFSVLSRFLSDFENPLLGLITLLKPFSSKITSMISSLSPIYSQLNLDSKSLRSSCKYSLIASDMSLPDAWLAMRYVTYSLCELQRWICLALLCCPKALATENSPALLLLKSVLKDTCRATSEIWKALTISIITCRGCTVVSQRSSIHPWGV